MTFKLGEYEVEEAIPEGTVHPVEITKCEVRDSFYDIDENDPSKGKKQQVSFHFKITEGEFSGRMVFGNTPTTFTLHPDCKLRAWVQSILGFDGIPVGFEFEPEDLVGMVAKVVIGTRRKIAADGTTVEKNFVADVLRSGSSSADPYVADDPF